MSSAPSLPPAAQLIPIGQLIESPLNPRQAFDPVKLDELAKSIAADGVRNPLLARPRPGETYELAAGHRRRRAAIQAGLEAVPVIVQEMTDEKFLEVITLENLGREDLHPLEVARGYRTLLDQHGEIKIKDLAAKVGKDAASVSRTLKYLDLIEPGQSAFLGGKLTADHAALIARLAPNAQTAALEIAIREGWNGRISARDLANWIDRAIHRELSAAGFSKKDAALVPEAGACNECSKRTGANPEAFPEISPKKDICLDPDCYEAKSKAFVLVRIEDATNRDGKAPLQVASDYVHEKGILSLSDWIKADKKKCPHLRTGVIVSGEGRGQALQVCAEKTCKVHRYGGRQSSMDDWKKRAQAADAKRKQEALVRTRIIDAILAKRKGPLAADDLRRLVLDLYVHQLNFSGDFWPRFGFDGKMPKDWDEKRAAVRTLAANADENRLAQLVVEMQLWKHQEKPGHGYHVATDPLLLAAKQHKVDVGKIEAAVTAELKEKKKAKGANGKKPAKAEKPAVPKKAKPAKKAAAKK